ncbi:MAG TPA: lactate utilization protein [Tissierellaceae bacterium]
MDNRFMELKKTLEKYGFVVKIFEDSKSAKDELLNEIKLDETVGIGGSMTIQQMGLYEDLRNRGNKVYWHWRKDEESPLQKAMNTDVYLTSTNAITMDGKLVNMDGNGNRVASMFFGHKNVYVLVGKNKICKDYDEARQRIRDIAAPLNAKRLNLSTPCAITGKCNDCNSPQKICKVETIIHRNPGLCQIHIYLIDEELGY